MKLHTREWGSGDRIAVLVHGVKADSRSWWRVGPALADRGYHAVAVDLPGHGASPRAEAYTPELLASSLLESVPAEPELAIAHSLGAMALALAVERLKPHRAVYSDPAFYITSAKAASLVESLLECQKATRDELMALHPGWSPEEIDLELEMQPDWDPQAVLSLDGALDRDFTPAPVVPSLIQIAGDSRLFTPECIEELRSRGFEVRVVEGAQHHIHRHMFDEFMAALKGWI